jgi:hypothetical protein
MKSPQQYQPAGPQEAAVGQPVPLNRVPAVSAKEIEQDTRLANPKLPYASKRTLKILEKMQQANPSLAQDHAFPPNDTDDQNPPNSGGLQK